MEESTIGPKLAEALISTWIDVLHEEGYCGCAEDEKSLHADDALYALAVSVYGILKTNTAADNTEDLFGRFVGYFTHILVERNNSSEDDLEFDDDDFSDMEEN